MKRTLAAAATALVLAQPAQANDLANALAAIIVGAIAVDAIRDDSPAQPQQHHNNPPRLTNWMDNHYHNHNYNRVCYREVIHNHGFTVVRELNCNGRILRETTQYNRH